MEGYVNSTSGVPISDAEVQIVNSAGQSEIVHTNSNGYYFGTYSNNATYTLIASSPTYYTITKTFDGTYLSNSACNFALPLLEKVTFTESGLHTDKWTVNFDGMSNSTWGGKMIFWVPQGNYAYTASSYGYGTISGTIDGSSLVITQSVDFSANLYFNQKFTASNVPSGGTWTTSIDSGQSGSLSSSGSITLALPIGLLAYGFNTIYIKDTSNGDTYVYSPSPSSGTVNITDSSTKTISTSYSLTSIESGGSGGGSGCVNATTEVLLANGTYTQAQNISIGTSVMTYNITNHQYTPEEVQNVYVSHHSRMYTINGYLQTSAYQPVLTNHGYIQAQNLTYKDSVYNAFSRSYVKIWSINESHGSYTMYDFEIPPTYDFIAWNTVVYDITIG